MKEKQKIEDWEFHDSNCRMCLPKNGHRLNGRVGNIGLNSSGVISVDIDRRIVITFPDYVYELGSPAQKYIDFIRKTQSDFLKFEVILNGWNKKSKFMEELEEV